MLLSIKKKGWVAIMLPVISQGLLREFAQGGMGHLYAILFGIVLLPGEY